MPDAICMDLRASRSNQLWSTCALHFIKTKRYSTIRGQYLVSLNRRLKDISVGENHSGECRVSISIHTINHIMCLAIKKKWTDSLTEKFDAKWHLNHTYPGCFTKATAVSIMVGGHWAISQGYPRPSTGWCQTFQLTAREEASISWTWTHTDVIGGRLLLYLWFYWLSLLSWLLARFRRTK